MTSLRAYPKATGFRISWSLPIGSVKASFSKHALDITTETLVQKFLRLVYRNHGLSTAKVSDPGAQVTSFACERTRAIYGMYSVRNQQCVGGV